MEKKHKIIISFIVLLLFFFLLTGTVFAQERQLEINYPTIKDFKPGTVATNLAEYVRYIFNFTVAIVGLVAFGVLVVAGTRYLTSSGKPEETRKSKKRIQAALLGLLILLFSFLIVTTINPHLLIFSLPGLTKAPVMEVATSTPISEPTADVYEKIKVLVNQLDQLVENIAGTVENCRTGWLKGGMLYGLKNDFARCKCKNALSACICGSSSGSGDDTSYDLDYCGDCNGLYCYNSPGHHICPQESGIKEYQQAFISVRDEILYIKNRILAEKADLLLEIDRLKADIDYYTKKIESENKVLQQLQDENAKKLQQDIISAYEGKKAGAEKEKFIKEEIIKHFDNLAKKDGLIDQMADEIQQKVVEQIDDCLLHGVDGCEASCSGGCHDTLGCTPEECGGKVTRCGLDFGKMLNLRVKINDEVQAILDIIKEGKEPETPGEPEPPGPPEPAPPGCPQGYKFDSGISKQCSDMSQPLSNLLTCMRQKLPDNVGRISSISDSRLTSSCKGGTCATAECCSHQVPCNTCGTQGSISCHYGGTGCSSQKKSYAADFGDEENYSAIRQAARDCDPNSYVLFEGNHVHVSVGNENGCQCN